MKAVILAIFSIAIVCGVFAPLLMLVPTPRPQTRRQQIQMLPAIDIGRGRNYAMYAALTAVSLGVVQFADRPQYWIDEQITRELVQRWTAWELLTVLPLYQPHYPTYYFLPEFLGWQATAAVSLLSLPVTVYATIRAGRALDYPTPASILAGGLVACSPYLAIQASWLRMYAPLTALLSVGFWLALDQRYRASAAVMLSASLLHIFGVFGVLWQSVLAFRDGQRRTAAATGLLGLLPPVVFVLVNRGLSAGVTHETTGMGHGIVPRLGKVVLTPVAALAGAPQSHAWIALAAVVTLVLMWPLPDLRVAGWILLPVLGIPLGSLLVHPVFRVKYFGLVAPAVALLAADPRRSRRRQAVLVLSLAGLYVVAWLARQLPRFILARRFMWH